MNIKKIVLQIVGLALTLCLFAGCGSPAPAPTTIPTNPPPTAAIPPTSTTLAHPPVSADAVRIQFEDTVMQYSPGDLAPNAELQVVFSALKGQRAIVSFSVDIVSSVALSIWGADDTVLVPETVGITTWDGVLPSSQDYYISLRSVSQQLVTYSMALQMPPLTLPEATRIQFQPNTTSWQTSGDLAPKAKIRFVLGALGGQLMDVNLTTEPAESALVYMWDANDGSVYTGMDFSQTWSVKLPPSQNFYIEVRSFSAQNITYQLNVEIH